MCISAPIPKCRELDTSVIFHAIGDSGAIEVYSEQDLNYSRRMVLLRLAAVSALVAFIYIELTETIIIFVIAFFIGMIVASRRGD
jgi:hypothetical protein